MFAHLAFSCGARALLGAMDGVQPGIFAMVLDKIWLPHAANAGNRRLVAAGTVDVLCRAPEQMLAAGSAYAAAWPRLLACALDLVDGANGSGSEGDEDEAAEQQLNALAGYGACFL